MEYVVSKIESEVRELADGLMHGAPHVSCEAEEKWLQEFESFVRGCG